MTAQTFPSPQKRVSILLFLGMLFFPIVFAWLLLRAGYSTTARVIAFGWLLVTLFLVFGVDGPDKSDAKVANNAVSPTLIANASTPAPKALPVAPVASSALVQQALPIARDSAVVGDIERRLQANEKLLRSYYGTAEQLRQTAKDIVQLAMLKVDYLDGGVTPEEKALGRKAAALGPKVETQARQIYASSLEETFVKSNIDAKVRTQGVDKKLLRVTYVLMSQPLVYRFQNELKLDEQARTFGFDRLVYSNGFESDLGKTWTVKLKD